jgi:NAD+ synthase
MELDHKAVRSAMVQGIGGYFRAAKRDRAIIGLSGGLDSAVAAQIAAEALGRNNVIGIALPYQHAGKIEDHKDWQDANKLAAELGINFLSSPITLQTDATAEVQGIDPSSPNLTDAEKNRLGNIKARQRMIVLMDSAEQYGGLVIGTGNKSEITVGYCTLYGDSACAIDPLGDIYKTEEFRFAETIGTPAYIRERAPSAGLYPGQSDEGQMGFKYAELDPLAFLLFDKGVSPEDAVEFGFTKRFVANVLRRHAANAFKFKMPPIIQLPRPESAFTA